MARHLDLTNNQYRMLLHQCDSLSRAGAQNFFNPGDWPQDELETYLYYRNQYFYGGADALLMLNVDFTPANNWNQQLLYLTYDELNALDFSAPKTAALPAGKSRKRRPGRLDIHARGLVYYCRMARCGALHLLRS